MEIEEYLGHLHALPRDGRTLNTARSSQSRKVDVHKTPVLQRQPKRPFSIVTVVRHGPNIVIILL